MATMNISLPDRMKEWVEAQVASGKYANASDFVRDLLREKQEHEEIREAKLQHLREMIRAGEESGVSAATLDDIWARVKARYTNA
ncbi:MAG: type II toxin-antitoxin system ParD family antitoxin [Bdellovibrionales bacterium]